MNILQQRPFRFGVLGYPACADLAAQARRAEELGYSAYHLSDHVFNIAPIAAMTAAALATSTIRIGSMVLGNDFWNPVILARELLAIDYLSNGRLEFGIGSGWYIEDYKQSGIPMNSPGVRISRLEESLTILKSLLSGETVSYQGKYYTIQEHKPGAQPVQHPHPPITIGGGGKRVLSLAARQADIVGLNSRMTASGGIDLHTNTLEGTRQKVEWVREAAGERLSELEFSILAGNPVITTSPEQAAARIVEDNEYWGGNLTVEQVLESPGYLVGDVEQIIEKLCQNRERFGFSYYVIFDGALESFAPVVKRLAGT